MGAVSGAKRGGDHSPILSVLRPPELLYGRLWVAAASCEGSEERQHEAQVFF